MTATRLALATAALAAVGAVGLTACTAGPSTDARVHSAASSATPATDGPSISPVPTPKETVASRKVSLDATGVRLPLEIYSLHREGSLVTLRFGLKNTTKDKAVTGGDTLRGSPFSRNGENDVSGVALVDTKNKKKHTPALLGGNCLCTNNLDDVAAGPGQTIYLTATYAAPPDDVTTMDVTFPKYGTFTAVPIN